MGSCSPRALHGCKFMLLRRGQDALINPTRARLGVIAHPYPNKLCIPKLLHHRAVAGNPWRESWLAVTMGLFPSLAAWAWLPRTRMHAGERPGTSALWKGPWGYCSTMGLTGSGSTRSRAGKVGLAPVSVWTRLLRPSDGESGTRIGRAGPRA